MASYLPEGFKTKRVGQHGLEVTDEKGELLMAYALSWVAAKLLNNERLDKAEKAVAGAAIIHLLSRT